MMSTVRAERNKDGLAVVEKKAMMDGHDQVFRRVVRFLKAAFRLAGEDELARRLTPALRRIRSGLDVEDGEDAEDQGSPADAPPAPGATSPEAEEQSP
jgi:hypothetical protein